MKEPDFMVGLPSRAAVLLVLLLGASAAASYAACPLEVSADGRYLIDCLGDPVTFNADSAWHLFARLTREEAIVYLDDRAARGMNALLVSLIVTDHYNGSTQNAYGDEPFCTPGDFTCPNEAYFAHIDWIVTEALARGFTLLIAPAYLGFNCGSQGWCQEMIAAGPTVMEGWGNWVGARYRDFERIIWVHGGDTRASSSGALDEVTAVANGILAMDDQHLHTAHCSRNLSADDCYDQPWLDVNTTYGDCTTTSRQAFDDYNSTPTRPSIHIEGRYEFSGTGTPLCIRGQAYATALGGGIGHHYGSHRIWDFPDTWANYLDTPGVQPMTTFGRLLEARDWSYLIPDHNHEVVVAGYGDLNSAGYVSVARGTNHKTALVYIPTQRTVTVSLASIDGQVVEATWLDPITGTGTAAGEFSGVDLQDFTSPSDQDWVLILDDKATAWRNFWNAVAGVPAEGDGRLGQLLHVWPNPSPGGRTRILFRVPARGSVELAVFDVAGRPVNVLVSGGFEAGERALKWNGRDSSGRPVASGVYFMRLTAGGQRETKRLVFLR